MIDVFLVDDERHALDTLEGVLSNFLTSVNVCGRATNIKEARRGITSTNPDLVLLDIEMGSESGFQLLEDFSEINFQVAFTTAYKEYAIKAIRFSALDYILKPIRPEELKTLIQRVEEQGVCEQQSIKLNHMFGNFITDDKSEHKITISLAEGHEFIKINHLLYIVADGSYSKLTLKHGEIFEASRNLRFFEEVLAPYGFYRIHNSTLINLKYIKRVIKVAGARVVMEDGQHFNISKGRKEDFLKLLSLR